jgi:hypothetical protein
VNGLLFGSQIEEARMFGRPAKVRAGEGGCVWLDFRQHGLELEYEGDRLAYVGVLVQPEEDARPNPGTMPAQAVLTWHGSTPLTSAIAPEDMIRLLGAPEEDDVDGEERILTHLFDGVKVESEFTPAGGLKRFSVWVE